MFKLFQKFARKLGEKIRTLFSGPIDAGTLDRLEELLYEADLGAVTAQELVGKATPLLRQNPTPEDLIALLKKEILTLLGPTPASPLLAHPHVILLVGANGSGKTTTLAKLARYYHAQHKRVLIAACDTYRAAAVEQLDTWASRTGVDIVRGKTGSDPSGVAFDAITAARARNTDILLVDTAGRLQNKTDLMHELAKIRRILSTQLPHSPHETLLVLDATIGQNALDQARIFHQFTPLTGIVLTKLDGTAKGGIAVAIRRESGIPIQWVGTGESAEDLAPFDPHSYTDSLLSF